MFDKYVISEVSPSMKEEETTVLIDDDQESVDIIDLEYKPHFKYSLRPSSVGIILSMVAHLLAFLIPCTVAYYALSNVSLFSWHPIGMTLTFGFLMTESILIFSKESSLFGSADRKTKVLYHAYALIASLLIAIGAFLAIFINKIIHDKPHFTSWHGILGLTTLVYMIVQISAGIILKYASEGAFRLPFGMSLGIGKLLHAVSGCFLYLLSCAELLLGMYSTWFQNIAHYYVQGACWVGVLMLCSIGMTHLITVLQERLPKKYTKKALNK